MKTRRSSAPALGKPPKKSKTKPKISCIKKPKPKPQVQSKGGFAKALRVLQTGAVPEGRLPCRENEFFTVYNFVKTKLLQGTGGCIYVSGVPGTGKTATVQEVVKTLKNEMEERASLPRFKFVEVNGLRLTDPHQMYAHMWRELTGSKVAPPKAARLLDSKFSDVKNSEEDAVVLLVDELDLVCTRKQSILYHIFEWPNKPCSKLIVISIANAMDLPERVMMNRIASRLGLSRLSFQPYNHFQLQEILKSRLEGLHVFDPDGVQLIARKVAAISGDARRALDICRRAVEIALLSEADSNKGESVGMKHVDAALQEIFSAPKVTSIRITSEQEQVFLRSIIQDFGISGLEESCMIDIFKHHVAICKYDGLYTPFYSEFLDIANNLYSSRIILISTHKNDMYKRVRLQVSVDDVTFALNIHR